MIDEQLLLLNNLICQESVMKNFDIIGISLQFSLRLNQLLIDRLKDSR